MIFARKSLRRKPNLLTIWAPKSINRLKRNCEKKSVSMTPQNYSFSNRLLSVKQKWKRLRNNNSKIRIQRRIQIPSRKKRRRNKQVNRRKRNQSKRRRKREVSQISK